MAPGTKLRDADKLAHIPIQVVSSTKETMLRKPSWLRIKLPRTSERIDNIKANLRKNNLHSVCEEASCPNLSESTILEIGPGPGALTRGLLIENARKVHAIEKDVRFLPA